MEFEEWQQSMYKKYTCFGLGCTKEDMYNQYLKSILEPNSYRLGIKGMHAD